MEMNSPDLLAQELQAVQQTWDGHLFDVQVKHGRICALQRLMYTWALLADLTPHGYGERWCYRSYPEASAALAAWDGADGTDPAGWHRHPRSGRRRDPDGREYLMP